VPSLLGPIFEEAGTGDHQTREALFLTFNVNLGFFEARLLGPVRTAGAAVTVVADAAMFEPDPRGVRSAGREYALGLAAMAGAFHPKLTILAGPERVLVGIGSGNLTIGGWHANDEVLTTIQVVRGQPVPVIVRDVVEFLRALPARIEISPLAVDGIHRTADQLATHLTSGEVIDTGHRLVDTVRGRLIDQLPPGPVDSLEISAPFHDLGGAALSALISRFKPTLVTVLSQLGQAVMDPVELERAAEVGGSELRFVQPVGEDSRPGRYRHGKVLTGLRAGVPVWSLIGSPNASAAALLARAPSGNCEIGVFSVADQSLLPSPLELVTDTAALSHTIPIGREGEGRAIRAGRAHLLEARAHDDGIEIVMSRASVEDLLVEVSPFASSPDDFSKLGVLMAGQKSAIFPGAHAAGTRIRVADELQFLALAEAVVNRLRPTGAHRPNHDASVAELFASEVIAAQWRDALTRLLFTNRQTGGAIGTARTPQRKSEVVANWRTLDDPDAWATYSEDALMRLGLPIFQVALGPIAASRTVGNSLPNTAPAWEDRFDDHHEAFEEGQTAETAETALSEDHASPPVDLTPQKRSRLRRFVSSLVEIVPQLGPLERIAVAQLATAGSAALIWDGASGPEGWFGPLAGALEALARDDWPMVTAEQAAGVAAIGLYRLLSAVADDERGREAARFQAMASRLSPMLSAATSQAVTDNLELLDGSTLVARTADDVMAELEDIINSTTDRTLIRVLERVMPDLDIAWVGENQLLLAGRTSNPKLTASQVLGYADRVDRLAVGVNAANGSWLVVARIPGRLTAVEGGKRPTVYRTYDTGQLMNPGLVLIDPEVAQPARLSTPPFTRPDTIDLEVLRSVEVTTMPLSRRDAKATGR
jgi:hypothetical protein